MGTGTTWPNPQIDVSRRAFASSSIRARSDEAPSPRVQPVRISTSFCEPIRHGTHLPHDSLRKNLLALRAMSSMHAESSQTTSAPEPSMEPASASDLKSMWTSAIEAGRYPEEGPEGAKDFNSRPSGGPPAQQN